MSNKTKSDTTTETSRATDAKASSTDSVQAKVDQEQAQGFRGTEVDSTPNENYTVAGVTSGAPTPETDADLARDVRQDTGIGLSALEASAREKKQRGEK